MVASAYAVCEICLGMSNSPKQPDELKADRKYGFVRVIAYLSGMFEYAAKPWKRLRFGLPFSLALHLLIGLLLWTGLSFEIMPAPKETIDVKLVPPPSPAPSPEPAEKTQPKPQPAPAPPPAAGSPAFAAATAKTEQRTEEKELPPVTAPETSQSDKTEEKPEPEKPAETEKLQEQEKAPDGMKPASEAKPQPEPKKAAAEPAKPKAKETANPTPAKELFSQESLSSFRVRQSARKMSARDRIKQLCTIEALEQLRRQRPGSFPDLLVPFGRSGGRISEYALDASGGAFRSRGDWYNINFQCTVDNSRSKVVSFSFAVGGSIPRSEWNDRRLPID